VVNIATVSEARKLRFRRVGPYVFMAVIDVS
jgi:hypothetical protein